MQVATACDEFLHARATRVLRLATVLAGNRQDGEDIAQECLARLVRAWRRGAPDDPDAYVNATLANLMRDRHRRIRRLPTLVPLQAHHDAGYAPVDHAAVRVAVLDALRRLPVRQRTVLVFRYYADLTEAQTAAALGCSVSTVKTHAQRGLAALRARLDEANVDPATSVTEGT